MCRVECFVLFTLGTIWHNLALIGNPFTQVQISLDTAKCMSLMAWYFRVAE